MRIKTNNNGNKFLTFDDEKELFDECFEPQIMKNREVIFLFNFINLSFCLGTNGRNGQFIEAINTIPVFITIENYVQM